MRVIRKVNILLDKKQKCKLLVLGILMLIGGGLETLGVSMIIPLASAILDSDNLSKNPIVKRVCAILKFENMTQFLAFLICIVILVFVLKNLFLMFQYYVQYRFVCNNKYIIQTKLFYAFLNKPYEYYLNASTGEITRVVSSDVGGAFTLLTTLLSLATELVVAFFLVVTIIIVDPIIALFVGTCLVIMTILITKGVKPILHNAAMNYVDSTKKANKWLFQAINGIKEVKVEEKEKFFLEKYAFYGKKGLRSEQINSVLGAAPRMLIETVGICGMLGTMVVLILNGRSTAELWTQMMAFAVAAVRLLPSANRINSAINAINYNEPMLDKVLENMGLIRESKTGKSISSEKRKLKSREQKDLSFESEVLVSHLTYRYPGAAGYVFENASMRIPKGKTIGVVGSSGAGKTTIIDVLLGLLHPQDGEVMVDGVNIQSNYSGWLSHVGYIPQMIFMLDDTIRANVAFGVDYELINDEDVWRALEEAQLADFVRSLPKGLETTIGERGIRISGGQRQRIGIARALYTQADVLIFDEATSALDNETEKAIIDSINAMRGRKTMIIIAHRSAATKDCDLMYRVHDGQITLMEEHK